MVCRNSSGVLATTSRPSDSSLRKSMQNVLVLQDPEQRERNAIKEAPAEFAQRIKDTAALWTPIVESLHIERQ